MDTVTKILNRKDIIYHFQNWISNAKIRLLKKFQKYKILKIETYVLFNFKVLSIPKFDALGILGLSPNSLEEKFTSFIHMLRVRFHSSLLFCVLTKKDDKASQGPLFHSMLLQNMLFFCNDFAKQNNM